MSETRNKGNASVSIDAALRDWPTSSETEKSAVEWDERADSVMGRLRRGERGASAAYVSDEDLFADPLGHSEEDGHKGDAPGAPVIHPVATPRTRERQKDPKMQTIDRDRDRKSLQDLAKMAQGMTPPPSSVAAFSQVPSSRSVTNVGAAADTNKSADDSGIVDLAAASAADPGAAMRAQSTPLASQSIYEDIPPPPPVNAPPSYSHVPSAPPPSGHMHAYQPAPSVPPPPVASVPPPPVASVYPIGPSLASAPQKKSGAGGLVFALGGLLAISAAAAGGFLYIRAHKATPAPVAAAQTVEAPKAAEPVVVAKNDEKPVAAEPVAMADKPADGTTDVNSLSATPEKSAKRVRSSGAKVAAAPKAEAPKADEPAPAQAKADKAKLDSMLAAQAGGDSKPAAPAGGSGDLGSAIGAAAGGGKMTEQQKPAAGSSGSGGNVPTKPSQGAVTGALGAVLPAARDCLGPDDVISRASVVFNSDGSVNAVSVSGGAAGKPAATCIEKELKKARLQPFAEPTYTANVTIRHN